MMPTTAKKSAVPMIVEVHDPAKLPGRLKLVGGSMLCRRASAGDRPPRMTRSIISRSEAHASTAQPDHSACGSDEMEERQVLSE